MDDHWIATSDGVRRLMHPAVKRNAAILPENPWEMGYVGGMSTVKDGNIYKAWHTCDDPKISWFRKTVYADSLSGLSGKSVPLRFALTNADLYAFTHSDLEHRNRYDPNQGRA